MIRTTALAWVLAAIALPAVAAAAPGNVEIGKKLHDQYCMQCHNDSVYTRTNRRIQSRNALVRQVSNCSSQTQKRLTPGEADDIVQYLNQTYYKFH